MVCGQWPVTAAQAASFSIFHSPFSIWTIWHHANKSFQRNTSTHFKGERQVVAM
jgi:hypothetical protein